MILYIFDFYVFLCVVFWFNKVVDECNKDFMFEVGKEYYCCIDLYEKYGG